MKKFNKFLAGEIGMDGKSTVVPSTEVKQEPMQVT